MPNPNWTDNEDQELRRLIEEYGPKKWSLIASKLKTKGSKQCRRRWKNYLNADLKQGGWTPDEDRILLDGHKRYGNKWTEIAKMVGGRTDNAVKNRWAALCKRTQRGPRATGAGPVRGRRGGRHVDADISDISDSSRSTTPPPPSSPRVQRAASLYGRGKGPLGGMGINMGNMEMYQMAAPVAAQPMHTSTLGKRQAGGMSMTVVDPPNKRQNLNLAEGRGLDLRSPRMRMEGNNRPINVFGAVARQQFAPQDQSPPYSSSYRSRASGSSHLTSASPPGRKMKPELTLLIPNAAADPPTARAQPGGLEIHVMRDLLSPVEVRYARELNEMEIPLQIALEDSLEPPLSTSRRAAQDALSALVADSPNGGGLGPLSLYGAGDVYGGGGAGPSSTTSGASDLNELLKWFATNYTPRSARAQAASLTTSRAGRGAGGGDVWASPVAGALGGAGASGGAGTGSPRPTTRAGSRLATPRGAGVGASPWEAGSQEGRQGATPRSGSGAPGSAAAAASGGAQGTGMDASGMHDGHRQLLSKLLIQARTGTEELHAHIAAASAAPNSQGSPAQTTSQQGNRPSRLSPRLAQQQQQQPTNPSNPSQHASPATAATAGGSQLTGAQTAAALAAMPMPNMPLSARGAKRMERHGSLPNGGLPSARGHPGPAGSLALSSLGGLLSPMLGNGGGSMHLGPLSSSRSGGNGGWAGLDVVLTPNLSQSDINMLLDLLTQDE